MALFGSDFLGNLSLQVHTLVQDIFAKNMKLPNYQITLFYQITKLPNYYKVLKKMRTCSYTTIEKHELCENKECIFENWEQEKEKTKIENALKECKQLIREIQDGTECYGVSLSGLKHKQNILNEELLKRGVNEW